MQLHEHKSACMEEFGQTFSELHLFLDSYAIRFRGHNHRRLLHHQLGVELCVEKFGEKARKPAEQHILIDLGFLPRNWKDMERHYFPLNEDEDAQQHSELIKLYGLKLYDEIENKLA